MVIPGRRLFGGRRGERRKRRQGGRCDRGWGRRERSKKMVLEGRGTRGEERRKGVSEEGEEKEKEEEKGK